ncbi:hypothetical protein BD410DRAFT_791453 [Rickenella mellea]|uniref:Uncharacterized protein n=1 Tax=Rickenella mellea TaxID=50990 RepID=A0A4Y7PXE7_9AGAM|nr:hypothetical protein BD410DRAFT_791453 [Rickenella mellea]
MSLIHPGFPWRTARHRDLPHPTAARHSKSRRYAFRSLRNSNHQVFSLSGDRQAVEGPYGRRYAWRSLRHVFKFDSGRKQIVLRSVFVLTPALFVFMINLLYVVPNSHSFLAYSDHPIHMRYTQNTKTGGSRHERGWRTGKPPR